MGILVVVEEGVDVDAVSQPRGDAGGLGGEELAGVVAGVVLAVEAQVGPVGGQAARVVGQQVVDAQGRAVGLQHGVDVLVQPARVAELDRPALAARRGGEEAVEPRGVGLPVRRQLDEDGAEGRAQLAGDLEEALDRFVRILEALDVAAVAAEFQGVFEALRRGLAPVPEGLRPRQVVEGVVDLDAVELAGVVLEPALLRQVLRVEGALPVRVLVAGGADAEVGGLAGHGWIPGLATACHRGPRLSWV